MNPINCYIFGGGGFIGVHLTKFLQSKGFDIICRKIDILDQKSIDNLLQNNSIDLIINCSGVGDFITCEKEIIKSFNINVTGVLNILRAIDEFSPITKFINLGSIKEFHNPSWYSQTKKISRDIVSFFKYQKGLWTSQLYLCNIIGNNQDYQKFVIPKIINKVKQAKSGDNSKIKLGNINSEIQILHIDNACELIWRAAINKSPEDYVLSGLKISIKNFLISAFHKHNIENWEDYIEIDKGLFRPFDSSTNGLDSYLEIVGLSLKKHDTLDNILSKLL